MATITQQQIELIQVSFNSVRPVSLAVAELFYAKLFDLDPSLRSMFKGDMARQGVVSNRSSRTAPLPSSPTSSATVSRSTFSRWTTIRCLPLPRHATTSTFT